MNSSCASLSGHLIRVGITSDNYLFCVWVNIHLKALFRLFLSLSGWTVSYPREKQPDSGGSMVRVLRAGKGGSVIYVNS